MSSEHPDPSKEAEDSPEEPKQAATRIANPANGDSPCGVPQRLHPSSVLFELVSHGRQFLIPAIIAFLGAAGGNWYWGIAAVIALCAAFLVTLFRYFTLRYLVKDGELQIHEGWLFRKERTVPVRKIQNMDLRQNPLHRYFGVAEVRIETAGGSEVEATLRVLTRPQIDALRDAILPDEKTPGSIDTVDAAGLEPSIHGADALDSEVMASRNGSDHRASTVLRLPIQWLLLAGAASNRGLLLVGIGIGTFFQFRGPESWGNAATPNVIRQWIPAGGEVAANGWFWAGIVLGAFLLLKLLGVCWYVLQFHGYRLDRVGNDLRVEGGLFTRYSASIPRQRIQFISVHRPMLLRWMGLASIRIETAGGATSGQENQQANTSRKWFVPVLPISEVPRILAELRPGLNWKESAVDWKAPSPKTWLRLIRFGILCSLVVGTLGYFVFPAWGLLAGVVLLPVAVWLAKRKSRSLHYVRTEFGVVFRSGIFYRKLSLTFFDRIQSLRLNQSPIDQRWKMASLRIDTAGAGPADHCIDIPFLDETLARSEFVALRSATSSHRPIWE